MAVLWQCAATTPGTIAAPAELAHCVLDWFVLSDPGTIAHARRITGLDELDPDGWDWWLRTDQLAGLVTFHGLSVPCTIYLDDVPVAEVESMFLATRVDVPDGAMITLHFGSVTQWLRLKKPRGRWRSTLTGEQRLRWLRTTLLGRADVYRAAPPPVGPWRPITTGAWIDQLQIDPEPATGTVRIAGVTAPDSDLTITIAEKSVHVGSDADGSFTALLIVENYALWFPAGYGAQPLYDLSIAVAGREAVRRRIGFRAISVITESGQFAVDVNGIRIFIRGAVWMPLDSTRLWSSQEDLHTALSQLRDAGLTMVRVPGGTVPEQDEFWDCCAELGLLVWHDCMLANFDPPPELNEIMVLELAHLSCRTAGNPALAVICGGSEVEQQAEMMGLDQTARDMPLLRELGAGVDVPYVPSSPHSFDGALAIRPNTGVAHWFGVGGYQRPLNDVRSAGVRFASECLAFSIPPRMGEVTDPGWQDGVPRDKGTDWTFEDVRDVYVQEIFKIDPAIVRAQDPQRYLDLGRAAVVEAMTSCFAFWRRADSGCDGAIVLNARDTRPGAGWGLIDAGGVAKAPLEALARVCRPRALTVSDEGLSGFRIDIHNDSPEPLEGVLQLRATTSGGVEIVTGSCQVKVAAASSFAISDSELTGRFTDLSWAFRFGEPVAQAVECRLTDSAGQVVARDAVVIDPAPATIDCLAVSTTHSDEDHPTIRLRSSSALRYVAIEIDGFEAADNWFHLPAAIDYDVALRRTGDRQQIHGAVRSIDLPGSIAIG